MASKPSENLSRMQFFAMMEDRQAERDRAYRLEQDRLEAEREERRIQAEREREERAAAREQRGMLQNQLMLSLIAKLVGGQSNPGAASSNE